MMRRILVSGASGIVGYGILRSLKNSDQDLFLVGSSIYDDSVAPAFCDLFEKAPSTNDEHYVEWLLSILVKHKIDMLIPGIEIDMYKWSEHISAIESTGATPLLNVPELLSVCKDKWTFYQHLERAGLRCRIDSTLAQDFEAISEGFGLPFLLKPRRGFGSKGIVRITDRETFMAHREGIGPVLMAQPLVGSDEQEYTTSVFGDGMGGYFASITLRRKLSHDGFTDRAEVVDSGRFVKTIDELCSNFRPLGPTNLQFRMCGDGPKLLEINPRISSSTSIRSAFGYNESAMAVGFFLEKRKPLQPAIRGGRAIRYIEERIFYEDGVHF